MVYGSKCGADNVDGDKFCRNCGKALVQRKKIEAEPKNFQKSYLNQKAADTRSKNFQTPRHRTKEFIRKPLEPIKESYTAAIVIGWLGALIFMPLGLVAGIYLISRDNKNANIHGFLMAAVAIILGLINYWYQLY